MIRRFRLSLWLALPLAVACGGAPPCPPIDTDIVWPRDEAPHPVGIEWWYYTGHLATAEGERFGFELTIFQKEVSGVIGYVGHAAVTDLQRQEHVYAQRVIAPGERYPAFDLAVEDWVIRGERDFDHLAGSVPGYAFALQAASRKPIAIHGGDGVVEMGGGLTSYYYSKTRLQVTGDLDRGAGAEPVTGLAWMDHQWGDFNVFASNGWDWFSLQLDDRHEVMLFLLHFKEGPTAMIGGTLVTPEGCVRTFERFEVQATGEWTSPTLGVTYPMGWRLSIPDEALEFTVEPLLLDQEIDSRATTLNTYWEGAVGVSGTHAGAAVSGQGYVELAGYGPWGLGN